MPTCFRPAPACFPLFVFLLCWSVPHPVVAADDKAVPKPTDYELMSLFVETYQQVESNYVRDIDRRELVEAAIQGMLKHLDQYSSFIPPQDVRRFNQMVEQEFGGIGITVNMRSGQLVVVSPLPGTPAHRAGIRAGDIIVEVEGEATDGISLSDAVNKLQGPVGRPVTVKVVHLGEDSEPKEIRLVRQLIKAPTVRGERYDENDEWDFMLEGQPPIGYVRLSHFSRFTAEEVKQAVDGLLNRDMKGLILDLRFNPGGLLESAVEIADMFLESGNIVSVRGRNVPERSWDAKKSGTFPSFPMAVLVNGYSASASEVLSACLQDNNRAIVVGERTWGKGSVQNVIRMEQGDSALKLTTASYHRPSGVNIHRFPDMKESDEWGVTPNEGFVIPYDRRQWRAWDEQRSRLDVLRGQSAPATDPSADDPSDESVEPFEDTQLASAIDYIRQQLEKEQSPSEATR
ncbi:MAG: S41 family peptidase [Fuerstiella sp.]